MIKKENATQALIVARNIIAKKRKESHDYWAGYLLPSNKEIEQFAKSKKQIKNLDSLCKMSDELFYARRSDVLLSVDVE